MASLIRFAYPVARTLPRSIPSRGLLILRPAVLPFQSRPTVRYFSEARQTATGETAASDSEAVAPENEAAAGDEVYPEEVEAEPEVEKPRPLSAALEQMAAAELVRPSIAQRGLAKILVEAGAKNTHLLHENMTRKEMQEWIHTAEKDTPIPATKGQVNRAFWLVKTHQISGEGLKDSMTHKEMGEWLDAAEVKRRKGIVLSPEERSQPATSAQIARIQSWQPHLPSFRQLDTSVATKGEAQDWINEAKNILRDAGKSDIIASILPGEENTPASIGQIRLARRLGATVNKSMTRLNLNRIIAKLLKSKKTQTFQPSAES
ncbi:hypothetical protein DACRYDRAFT_115948 [Dacryopinax primogenitus]|uniref:Uncharacterized protein n=1 Tax=Dacryopinax primogenitus (strain DJM 731) TaxID=1858805 RepID=M5G1V3_DACPD|nr:uncharacterized protein DACRYDRAFT_115948 [Dacryopinax primogenitus]EJU02190.1 hypothetical protein DACRYDRAFT_115948 [Dacryopinax primogenitus]